MLIKSGVFDASGQNLKLDIRSVTADGWYTAQGRQEAIKYAMKLFPNSAIKLNGNIYTSENIGSRVKYADTDGYYLNLNLKGPIEVIPNAWGMKSVTLDGNPINYAKDWYGAVEEMDNSTAHTLKFEWYPLAQELKDAGYTYRANFDCYTVGSNTPTTSVPISATATEYSHTIHAGEAPSVYPFDLQLNLDKNGSSVGIFTNDHIVKLVVSEAPPAPPAPVAHSITITNTHGTATPATAIAGETVTVKADDRTGYSQMFTQWYTKTAGVTFADATKQETTFVMPDCDVEVNPGFQQVSFTNQPTDSWLSAEDDSKVYFAFSQPITSWKLVNENDQTLASGDAADANALVAAKLILQPENTVMTCRVIVTANGQDFTSNAFTLKWYKVPGAPDVTVYPAGGKFVETLSVNLKTPSTYWEIAYTTDGSDPYDKSGTEWLLTPSAKIVDDSTQVPISKDTTIKACLYNYDGPTNMQKFGDIVTCDFTKVELTPPVADPPSGTSFYDSLNVSLSTDIVNAKIMWSDKDLDVDDLGLPGKWKEYEPEKESITLSGSYGMHGFYALTGIRMEHPDGYTYWVHSDKQDYSYPRITYATIADASVTGKVNEEINPVDVSITLSGDVFAEDLTAGTDVSGWFTNRPTGLTAKVKERTNHTKTLVITISGTPTATSAAAISVEMPKNALRYTGTGTAVEQTVLPNSKAVYNIGTDVAHTHDYTGQPYLYLDPGNHYQECTANDGYNIQPHEFTPWTDNGNDTHSRHCTVCKMTDGSTYTETANHNWQWVVDNAATPNAPGKQHEECVDCHVKRSENTEIPMLTSIMVEHLTVAKPVKDAAAAIAATADSSYTVANTEWMAADGTPLAIGGKFQPGTVYTVKITLETAGAGVFSVKSTYNTIEGKTATVSPNLTGDNHADSVILTYTFDATEGSTGGSTGGGGGSGGGGVTTYAITVKDSKNGDVTASHKSAAKGTTVTLTVDPDKGYVLDTLTVLDDKDKEIKLTEKNGKYVFTMPSGKVTVAGRFKVEQPAGKHPFTDIPSGAYYENAVIWAADKGITGGTSATTFAPNGICTRAQAVTFLWRAAGSPAPKSMNSFADVPADAYYAKAVAWAVENGITSGTGGGKFSPDATCTRAQIVTFLYRAAGSPAVSGGSVFSDVKAGAYYADAVTWAANKGITGGIGNGLFGSDNNCTRAQIVTFLYRYVE
ncbi:S-layer homology domain-containing protein [Evtepia gabavorous]|uniref:S-layer homology domain-containing protein n=1 Tax=Evtepia gabavorous TaxID=2211183 RepID=UPI003A903FB7